MAEERRVIGPPGTGKTYSLRQQVEKWVEGDEYAPDEIVLTSFTRSAAAVLAGRIPVPRQNIATLHALAYRGLGSPPLAEEGDLAKQWNEAHANRPSWQVGKPVASEEDGLAMPDAEVGEMMRLYSLARMKLVPTGHPYFNMTREWRQAWDAFKEDMGAVDFADMIEMAVGSVMLPAPVLIVDEAQDLTPLQWMLARYWGEQAERFIVSGDPAQVLYNFAGARPDDFLTEIPEERIWRLGQRERDAEHHRLPLAIQQFAEGSLRRHSGPMMVGREYRPRAQGAHPDAVGAVRYADATWRRPDEVVEMIAADPRDCMVLASCSYMLQPLVAQLRERGIAFHNPYRTSNGAWNPLARRSGESTADKVAAFFDRKPSKEWIDLVKADTFIVRRAKHYIEEGGETAESLARPEHKAQIEQRDIEWLRSRLLTKFVSPANYAIDVIKRSGSTKALTETPRVVAGTIHSVKGAESKVVYVFPDVSMAGREEMHSSIEGADAAVRLAYVGFTRASEELVLCGAADMRGVLW